MKPDPESSFDISDVTSSNQIEETNLSLVATYGESEGPQYSASNCFEDIDSIYSVGIIDSLEAIWGNIESSSCSYNYLNDKTTNSNVDIATYPRRTTDDLESLVEVMSTTEISLSDICNNSHVHAAETSYREEFVIDTDGTIDSLETVWGDSQCTSDDDSLAVNVGESYTDYSDINESEDELYVKMCLRAGVS